MRISRINRIKNHCIFRDYEWPSDLTDFNFKNVIYGWNGSGKSTLSRIFQAIEKNKDVTEGEVELFVDTGTLSGIEFHDQDKMPSVRVFNRDFVYESVLTGYGSIKPIFYLGKENVEKQKKIEELRKKEQEKKDEYTDKGKRHKELEADLDNFCFDRGNRTIKDLLSSSGGDNPYNTYNKSDFRGKCEELINTDVSALMLTADEKVKLRKQKEASAKPKINRIQIPVPSLSDLHKQTAEILLKKVVSQVIARFEADPWLADWIKKGLAKHKQESPEECLFCGQQLTAERIKELEGHFNDEYNKLMADIKNLDNSIDTAIEGIKSYTFDDKAKLYDHLSESYPLNIDKLQSSINELVDWLATLKSKLADKQNQPFKSLSLDIAIAEFRNERIDAVNVIIDQHNEETDNFSQAIKEARKKLELSIVAESLESYKAKKDSCSKMQSEISSIKENLKNIQKEIAELEKEIVEHRRPADQLNADLTAYLGRDELQFKVEESGYLLTRNGNVISSDSLSEGEKTAIAFIYFLKTLYDKDFDITNSIVVIDDPVSSLDSNALFYAFSFLRERTEGPGQLLILTHNFSFYRQIKNWFHKLKGQNKKKIEDRPARFYMLKSEVQDGMRGASLTHIDPLLERYDSEYHYMFSVIHSEASKAPTDKLEAYYHLPNIARRILESFLAFRKPKSAGELKTQLESLSFDNAKKTRILRFLHTHSHNGQIDEPEHDLSILSETPQVLNDVLELIKSEDERHYNEMVNLISEGEMA